MIYISKAPYRISLLGGGSDLDWFVRDNGFGLSLGFSIDKYSSVVISVPPQSTCTRGILSYSSREEYIDVHSISHPFIRTAFLKLGVNNPVELASFGQASSGAGLGGSSSFLIALVSAIFKMQGICITSHDLASIASDIEISDLSKPIGRQDHYLCALGGFNALRFLPDHTVQQLDIKHHLPNLISFCNSLILVSTGITRSATSVLSSIQNDRDASTATILKLRNIANEFINRCSEPAEFSPSLINYLEVSMLRSWELKKTLPNVITPPLIELETFLHKLGFQVLKLLGAGGGGYFLCKPIEPHSSLQDLLDSGLDAFKVVVSSSGCVSWQL